MARRKQVEHVFGATNLARQKLRQKTTWCQNKCNAWAQRNTWHQQQMFNLNTGKHMNIGKHVEHFENTWTLENTWTPETHIEHLETHEHLMKTHEHRQTHKNALRKFREKFYGIHSYSGKRSPEIKTLHLNTNMARLLTNTNITRHAKTTQWTHKKSNKTSVWNSQNTSMTKKERALNECWWGDVLVGQRVVGAMCWWGKVALVGRREIPFVGQRGPFGWAAGNPFG